MNTRTCPWCGEAFGRRSTGDGFALRQLYTDQDEVLFDAARPVILTGIEDIVTRPDLADRAVLLTLEPIPEERRRPEAELWATFEAERPRILGVLLDAVVEGLSAPPSPRAGRKVPARFRDGCGGPRLSCARSASRSTTARKAGRAPGSFTSRQRALPPFQNIAGRNRPHRPHRPHT